jgi:sugar phosphate isomerase/epimerase
MKLGVFSPVFGKLDLPAMLARVRALGRLQAIELATGGWPGRDHMDPQALLADDE